MGNEWIEMFKIIASLLTVLFTGVMAYMTAVLNIKAAAAAVAVGQVREKAEEAAVMVKKVKTNLQETTRVTDKKLDEIDKVGKAVHVLVNSNMGIQLKISAVALRRIASMNKNSKEDQLAAKLAESALKEHEKRQEKVDSMKGGL